MDRGIVLTGDGSLLRGLDRRLSEEIGMQATLTDDPLGTVALGIGRALEELGTLKSVLITGRKSPGRMRG